jgi:hypothetical protein
MTVPRWRWRKQPGKSWECRNTVDLRRREFKIGNESQQRSSCRKASRDD